jgi:hypothetical protein
VLVLSGGRFELIVADPIPKMLLDPDAAGGFSETASGSFELVGPFPNILLDPDPSDGFSETLLRTDPSGWVLSEARDMCEVDSEILLMVDPIWISFGM